MKEVTHRVDLCVVGGGMAGLCAALATARHGAKVALIQDRPVLGGNASSEIRMWICGAHGANNRETGILEEILLENLHRNPSANYSLWDSVLYEKARFQENLTLLLNCTCTEAALTPLPPSPAAAGEGGERPRRIQSVRAWQLTSETWHTVEAGLFADCSGDSILAPLTGAEYRVGREAAGEFGEDIQPEQADRKTMGMSLLIQSRETDRPQPFTPPAWANKYLTDEELPYRGHGVTSTNFWWIELGGEDDSIHDTERMRDELLKIALGVWDHIKNHGDHGAENWVLDWMGFLPGKRESRRYVGDHILTQNDVRAEGRFDDLVAFGGWSMDDHHPGGIRYAGPPTIFHPAPSPYGIPYRSLYSRNIANLFFAGRNISATHAALSSTRVMATCSVIGQAMGTAAAIAARDGLSPRGVYQERLAELQQTLMEDDCYLPWHTRAVPALSLAARLSASEGDPEPLRNGVDRPVGEADNGWCGRPGAWVEYAFDAAQPLREARIVFDSDLNRGSRKDGQIRQNARCAYRLNDPPLAVPPTMTRAFRIEVLGADGEWRVVASEAENYQRLVRVPLNLEAKAVRLVLDGTWGAAEAHVFAFDVR